MSISCISDIHIKMPGDLGEKVLLSFLENKDVQSSNTIYLLGDIFDLMVGSYDEYLTIFEVVFKKIEEICKAGKKVVWVEGNHDFHINSLINHFKESRRIPKDSLILVEGAYYDRILNQRIRLSHGDDIELGNISYKIYKSLIRSSLIGNLMKFFVPYSFVAKIGRNASQKSRERNKQRYSSFEDEGVKELFRKSAMVIHQKMQADIIICGHSHVRDCYAGKGFSYLNNGFCKATLCFSHVSSTGEISLKSLDVHE